MRFVGCLSVLGCVFVLSSAQAETAQLQGYSKTYIQCMSATYGTQNKTKTCVNKELKLQKKLLKKNFKTYQKANRGNVQQLKQQHQFWQALVKQQCPNTMHSTYGKLQQAQCELNMIISQSNLYAARSLNRRA
jgi:hypothetical protein